MHLLFSHRYHRAIEQTILIVDIPDIARRKLWTWLSSNNTSLGIQRDPNDNWISNSSILEETEGSLLVEHGWERLPVESDPANSHYHSALRLLVLDGQGVKLFAYSNRVPHVVNDFVNTTKELSVLQCHWLVHHILFASDCSWPRLCKNAESIKGTEIEVILTRHRC